MSDDNGSSTALTPSEEAFFESGGQTDPGLQDDQSGGDGDEGQQQGNQDGGQVDPNAQQQGEQAAKPEKTVPLAALHQARHELREAKARSERLEQTFQQFMRLQAQGQGQGQQQPQIPDPNEDPIGYFQAQNQMLEQRLEQLAQQSQQTAQQGEQQRQEQQFLAAVTQVETQFAATTPDYNQATQFLQQHLVDGLLNQGYSEQEAVAGMRNQVRTMIQSFMQAGLNPAEMGYAVAKARGYQAPAAAAAPNKANAEKIAQLNKGQAAARSLSTAGGAGKAAITLEALAEMDPAELEKNWEQVKKFM